MERSQGGAPVSGNAALSSVGSVMLRQPARDALFYRLHLLDAALVGAPARYSGWACFSCSLRMMATAVTTAVATAAPISHP